MLRLRIWIFCVLQISFIGDSWHLKQADFKGCSSAHGHSMASPSMQKVTVNITTPQATVKLSWRYRLTASRIRVGDSKRLMIEITVRGIFFPTVSRNLPRQAALRVEQEVGNIIRMFIVLIAFLFQSTPVTKQTHSGRCSSGLNTIPDAIVWYSGLNEKDQDQVWAKINVTTARSRILVPRR